MKNMLKTLLFFLIVLGGMGTAHALIRVDDMCGSTPASNLNFTADCEFDIYIDGNSTIDIVANSTAINGISLVGNNTGCGGSVCSYNLTIDISAVSNGEYSITAVANWTEGTNVNGTEYTTMGIDDTGPTIAWTALADTTIGDTETISGTCTDSDFSYTVCSACSYYQVAEQGLGDCTSGCSMTISDNTITYSYTSSVYGARNSFIECTDQHSQATNATSAEITIHSRGSGAGGAIWYDETITPGKSASEKATTSLLLVLVLLGALMIVGTIVWYYYLRG